MANNVTILCSACTRDLYRCFQLSSGQPCVFPADPTVPWFREGYQKCPYCEQPMYLEFSGQMKKLLREDGYIRVA